MIDKDSITKEWISDVSCSHKKADKMLVEKVIWALILLEQLALSGMRFCFKGGTCAMLMTGCTRRMSIDIDIIVPSEVGDLINVLRKVSLNGGFLRCEPILRKAAINVPKEHYKFYYQSALSDKENFILLDILRENILYLKTIQHPIESDFLKQNGELVSVTIPDFDNIIADKLTAFAPNTTGIPYVKKNQEMGMEIMKQMYDIGCLFDYISDVDAIRNVYCRFCKSELNYRGSAAKVEDVLQDTIKTALSLCLKKDIDESTNFRIIGTGVKQVNSQIFSESFNLDTAVVYAAKTACLAAAVKSGAKSFEKFQKTVDMSTWTISSPWDTKLNKLKKSSPEAFYYLWLMTTMLNDSLDTNSEL